MSFINKIKNYDNIEDLSNRQKARILELENEVTRLKDRMKRMSDTTILRDELDYMNVRYEKLKADIENNV